MTIALGVLAGDGIVLAADTQVAVPGSLKTTQGKVTMIGRNDGTNKTSLIISGAGPESSINHIRRNLTNSFEQRHAVMSALEIGDELQKNVLDFHAVHVTPHGKGTLDVWMLVCAIDQGARKIWSSEVSVVTEESVYAAVGIGNMYARILMNRLYRPMNTIGAILLTAYIVNEVKKNVDGCGDKTEIIAISQDRIYIVEQSTINRLEALFEEYYIIEAGILRELFHGNVLADSTPRQSRGKVNRLKREMASIIERLQQLPDWAKFSQSIQSTQTRSKPDSSSPQPWPESPEGSDES